MAQAHEPLVGSLIEPAGRGPQEPQVAGVGKQLVKRRPAVPEAAEILLVEQAGGQRAVHLAERQVGQQHLEPFGVGPRVAKGGEHGAGRLDEFDRAAAAPRCVRWSRTSASIHMSRSAGQKPSIWRFACRLNAPSNPPIARQIVFGDPVVVAGHRALEELGADDLQEQGDAVGAAVAGDLAGDRLGHALGEVEPAVLLERDFGRVRAGAPATWGGGSRRTIAGTSRSASRYSRTPSASARPRRRVLTSRP